MQQLTQRAKNHIIYVIALAMFMELFDASVLNTSLPQIAKSLHSNPIDLKAAITTYLLTLGVFIPATGWLADRVGERISLFLAIGTFLLSSIGCAFAHSLTTLVVFRSLQGAGGALLTPVARLVMIRVYGKEQIVRAMTTTSLMTLFGLMFGPIVGGAITTYLGWRWIFLLNIPAGLFAIEQIYRFLPKLTDTKNTAFDWLSFLLMGISLGILLFFFDTIVEPIFNIPEKLCLLTMAIVSMAVCVWHSKRCPHPLIDFAIFGNRIFSLNILGSLFSRLTLSTTPFLIPLMLQTCYGFSALRAGLFIIPGIAGALVSKRFVAKFINQFNSRSLLLTNTSIIFVLYSTLAIHGWQLILPLLVAQQFMIGFTSSTQLTTMNSLIYQNLQEHEINHGSTIYSAFIQLSGSFGVAIAAVTMVAVIGANHLTHHVPGIAFKVVFITQSLFVLLSGMVFYFLPRSHAEQGVVEKSSVAIKATANR